ncbi:MAG: phosphopyruvate hydratase [Chloroflexota bacterium]
MNKIDGLRAFEILDSRGRPTVMTVCKLSDGSYGKAAVPSGASTGTSEAVELRDGDDTRYNGLGCLQAVNNVNTVIRAAVTAQAFASQQALDDRLIALDGTHNKSKLGANAILSVSLAFARACAMAEGVELYEFFGRMADTQPRLPRPMINLFSGGKHAGQQVSIQDVQIAFPKAESLSETFAAMYDIYYTAARQAQERYGVRLLTADEGGLAPPFASSEEMLGAAVAAIDRVGLIAGQDACLTVDVAATHFYNDTGQYDLDGAPTSADGLIDLYEQWIQQHHIVSLEDALHEEAWPDWTRLATRIGNEVLVLGDDLLCTNPQRIEKAIASGAANSLLLKVNQIGTLSEALAALKLARQAGWQIVISARSGETEDNWLADLATGWAADYIKVGSITQSERLAKYNRLLELEALNTLSL